MLTTIEKLLVLQDKDRRIKQLLKESEDIPARKKLIETRLEQHRQALVLAQDALKRNQAAVKQVEIDIDSTKQQILKLRDQQGQIKTNDAYRALEKEIGAAGEKIRAFEDQEIVLMEEQETLRSQVNAADQKLKAEQASVGTDTGVLDQRLAGLKDNIGKLQGERAELVKDIEPDWLSRYERTFKHKGDFGLVPIENYTCGGCHMKLPPQVLQDVKKNLAMCFCSFCGRMLYWRP